MIEDLVGGRLPDLNSPLYKTGELLAISGSPDAAAHFLEKLSSDDRGLREYGAWGIGNIALASGAEVVKRILAAEDRRIRTFAALGVSRALASKRGEPAFFDAIRSAVDEFLYFENGDIGQTLVEIEREQGTTELSNQERNFFAASMYFHEIENGGPWQYFGNSAGNYHRMIVAGLKAIGAPQTAQTLIKAGEVFGPDGPPEDCGERNAMVDAFTAEQVKRVDDLYRTFPSGEDIPMLLFLYVLKCEHGQAEAPAPQDYFTAGNFTSTPESLLRRSVISRSTRETDA